MMIPAGEHWAIVEIVTVHIPGDERSRQAPGHGYPERDEEYIRYTPFTGEDAREQCLSVLETMYHHHRATAIHVTETYNAILQAKAVKQEA